jgi:hypothetical protein
MDDRLTISFYRTKRLHRLTVDFTIREISDSLDEPCKITLTKSNSIKEFRLFIHLWNIVRKYRETILYAGQDLLTLQQAENIMHWVRCFANSGYFSDNYCCMCPGIMDTHGWGCKWLVSVARHESFPCRGAPFWYQIGRFDGTVQYIDKQEIKKRLLSESSEKYLAICPLFVFEKIDTYINELPDKINPTETNEWEYTESADELHHGELNGIKPHRVTLSDLIRKHFEL